MSDRVSMPTHIRQAISDRFEGVDPARREQFADAMNKLNAHMATLSPEERGAFAEGIAELQRKTQNGEALTEEDLEAVSGGAGWQVIGAWVAENFDWKEFKKGVVAAWNET